MSHRFINLGLGRDDYESIFIVVEPEEVIEIDFDDLKTEPLGYTVIGPAFDGRAPARPATA